jgi:hypothetical protein
MIKKKVIDKNRIRRIDGGFGFIPHRFITDGFVSALHRDELLLYFFLSLVSDRNGLSFYGYDKICLLLELSLDEYMASRNSLIEKNLIAFDGSLFQVLSLPEKQAQQKQKAVQLSVDNLTRQTAERLRFDR